MIMWTFVKHKLEKLGCFFLIALCAIGATAGTRIILGWFHFDEARKEALSAAAGEYVGKGLLGMMLLVGLVFIGFQLRAELRAKGNPPPLPASSPPPLPPMENQSLLNAKDDRSMSGGA